MTQTLARYLDIAAAGALHKQLLSAASAEDGTLLLDAAQVESITSPCFQLLLAAGKEGKLQIRHPSAAFLNAMKDLGLQNAFAPYLTEESVL